jgi:carbamoyl-phosphate synthase large subunit
MLHVCREHDVALLLSLHDLEAPILSRHKASFESIGTTVVISSPAVIDTCLDKYKSYEFCMAAGFMTPRTYPDRAAAEQAIGAGEVTFPLVIKPRYGLGSAHVQFCDDAGELRFFYEYLSRHVPAPEIAGCRGGSANRLIVQERIRGDEYGLDVVNDLSARYAACFGKRKFTMHSGETDEAETVQDSSLEALGRRISEALGHVGVLDADLLVKGNVPYLLDMNPRFGGGYPFSHAAGANVPAAILAWKRGESPDPSWLRIRAGVRSIKDIGILTAERGASRSHEVLEAGVLGRDPGKMDA